MGRSFEEAFLLNVWMLCTGLVGLFYVSRYMWILLRDRSKLNRMDVESVYLGNTILNLIPLMIFSKDLIVPVMIVLYVTLVLNIVMRVILLVSDYRDMGNDHFKTESIEVVVVGREGDSVEEDEASDRKE